MIDADPIKMHDALRNLVENAVNYSSEGGRIELGARVEEGRVLLTVGDYGPGMPDADLNRVFERFYRVDKSRTRDPGGTGLGLSIVRHLVELHGGRVHADNRRGGGAIFTISLPGTPAADAVGDQDARGRRRSTARDPETWSSFSQWEYLAIAMPTISSISWVYVRPALRAACASSAREASHGLGLTSMTDTVPSGFSRMSTRP